MIPSRIFSLRKNRNEKQQNKAQKKRVVCCVRWTDNKWIRKQVRKAQQERRQKNFMVNLQNHLNVWIEDCHRSTRSLSSDTTRKVELFFGIIQWKSSLSWHKIRLHLPHHIKLNEKKETTKQDRLDPVNLHVQFDNIVWLKPIHYWVQAEESVFCGASVKSEKGNFLSQTVSSPLSYKIQ